MTGYDKLTSLSFQVFITQGIKATEKKQFTSISSFLKIQKITGLKTEFIS